MLNFKYIKGQGFGSLIKPFLFVFGDLGLKIIKVTNHQLLAHTSNFFVDPKEIKFGKNPRTKEYSVFIPNAGDHANMLDVLEKFEIGELPYTSPHLR